jgi:hypothetical protein
MLRRVIASISSLMVLSVVVTVQGNNGWQFDFRQMGRAGEETHDTLQLMAGLLVDMLMLDIVWVIVVLAVEVTAEILVLQRVSVSWMTASSWDEIVKLVGSVGWIVDQVFQFKRGQNGKG